jgi:hypothetical protein
MDRAVMAGGDGRGMLEDHPEHHDARVIGLCEQDAGRADPEVDLALSTLLDGRSVYPPSLWAACVMQVTWLWRVL